MPITIRLRYAQNERTTLQIEPDTTYEQLKNMIFSATKIPTEFQELKYGYPPKPLPPTVTDVPNAKLSSIPIEKGEQIIVTENRSSAFRSLTARATDNIQAASTPKAVPAQTSSQGQADIAVEDKQGVAATVPPPVPLAQPVSTFFETAPTPRSTISTATHTPTPAPSVPRTIMPSPITYNYPGTGPASATSTTSVSAPYNHPANLAVPSSLKGGLIGTSPLAEKNHGGLLTGQAARENGGHSGQRLGDQNVPTSLSESGSGKPNYVELNDGMGSVLVHRVVPDDNSCLFSAIGLVFKGHYDASITQELRQVVVDEIRKDPVNFSDVMLGRSREEYIQTIQKPSSWGGAIELAILAKHFKTEISSYDVLTGRADRFGEGQYDNRCILIYSGIHYDAATSTPTLDAPVDFQTSIFPVSDTNLTKAAEQLVKKLKEKHYYTDTQNFDLRCQVCQIGLKGEQGAREHAIKTGPAGSLKKLNCECSLVTPRLTPLDVEFGEY
ncbi:hypothetical protein QFC21_004267 [Naganishia friedmannii]|uniref:Uncharacterized protein n=1 Tax=Naganishia friedmannii TaxID=89922 RepID=A0ACC2VGU6_9TREE|nr:hypothetical protein QFC21_004267 [Naganishia friedmannii]